MLPITKLTKILSCCSILCFMIFTPCFSFEPVTLTIAGGLGAAGIFAGVNYLKCKYYECCNEQWIQPDLLGLEIALKHKLHGQHLAREVVMKALRGHLTVAEPKKALVLSFHGWTGIGKSYASKIIADYLYKNGLRSDYVHHFDATLHFRHPEEVKTYQKNLQAWIKGNISICERSLFIFDEMSKMPPGLIDVIKPFIDYNTYVDGKSVSKAVFIFLSNTGDEDISLKTLEFWKSGQDRNTIKMKDMEELVRKRAFNEEGGLRHSYLMEKHLIDFHVPFLPLEREHVRLCVKDAMRDQKIPYNKNLMEKVVDALNYYPSEHDPFSTTGCKGVSQLLNQALE